MGFLADKAAAVKKAEADKARTRETARRKRDGDPTPIGQAPDPERCGNPGSTLARDPRLPDLEPDWTDYTADLDLVAASAHKGRRLAVRVCPDCREVRGNGGAAGCWCGSTADPVRLDGRPTGAGPVRRSRGTSSESGVGPNRMPAWHVVQHATRPAHLVDRLEGCRTCDQYHRRLDETK